MAYDLVLSSGFLAFARHAGFLAAVEEAGLEIRGMCGTSSGALVGSLWASGMSAREVLDLLAHRAPLQWATLHCAIWRGAFRLDSVIAELTERLPATFDALGRPFGVGVADLAWEHRLLTSGPLPVAVAASCAVPRLFAPVRVGDEELVDGATADRTALSAWQAHRPDADVVVHLIDRTAGVVGPPIVDVPVVRSPKASAKLWSMGDFEAAFRLSKEHALGVFRDL